MRMRSLGLALTALLVVGCGSEGSAPDAAEPDTPSEAAPSTASPVEVCNELDAFMESDAIMSAPSEIEETIEQLEALPETDPALDAAVAGLIEVYEMALTAEQGSESMEVFGAETDARAAIADACE